MVLEETLGPAFNARYMSVNLPSLEVSKNYKRKVGYDLDFYVGDQHEDDFDEQPAWSITNHIQESSDVDNSR